MSKFITGSDRNQITLFPVSIDQAIEHDNQVRVIDAFVNSLELSEYGFKSHFDTNGRPAYHPACLLKLYIYGYLINIRSSRRLEKECQRNIEAMWLMHQLKPDHNTIANFRKDNDKAIKKVFRATVKLADYFELIGKTLVAGDSTKLRAQNSKKNNYNAKKIERHLKYIDDKIEEHNRILSQNDGDQQKKQQAQQEIDKQQKRKEKYTNLQNRLEQSPEPQISTSDPQSRQMITRNNITEVAYNVQTTVDAKNNIPVDYKVTNTNDSKAMGNMLQRAKTILSTNSFTALYDKGYHTGSEFDIADQLGIKVMVAIPAKPKSSQAPDPAYNAENFTYNPDNNTFTCPQGNTLTTNGTWHKASSGSRFQQFKTRQCKNCIVRHRCTSSKQNGRILHRTQYANNIEINKQRIENEAHTYRRRQAIVEHPYGTIKRQWGFSYIMTKKFINRANADVGLIMTAYNLRRIMTIIGVNQLQKCLELWAKTVFSIIRAIWLHFLTCKPSKKINRNGFPTLLLARIELLSNRNLVYLRGF